MFRNNLVIFTSGTHLHAYGVTRTNYYIDLYNFTLRNRRIYLLLTTKVEKIYTIQDLRALTLMGNSLFKPAKKLYKCAWCQNTI
jgi:hypothetical protein